MDYQRDIIYLRDNRGTAGYVRMECRDDRMSFHVEMKHNDWANEPFYLVWEKDKERYPFELVLCPDGRVWDYSWNGMELLGVCGIAIGNAKRNAVGTCEGVSELVQYEQLVFERKEENDETSFEEKSEPEVQEVAEETEKVEAEAAEEAPDFPVMYPFEDDEMLWCYQLMPEDIGRLPMPYWHEVNNTFLLQGYLNYRHLLYVGDGKQTYLGVPGQFHRRDRYLAGRSGFSRFKGTQKKIVTIGDFGYWLKPCPADPE